MARAGSIRAPHWKGGKERNDILSPLKFSIPNYSPKEKFYTVVENDPMESTHYFFFQNKCFCYCYLWLKPCSHVPTTNSLPKFGRLSFNIVSIMTVTLMGRMGSRPILPINQEESESVVCLGHYFALHQCSFH